MIIYKRRGSAQWIIDDGIQEEPRGGCCEVVRVRGCEAARLRGYEAAHAFQMKPLLGKYL